MDPDKCIPPEISEQQPRGVPGVRLRSDRQYLTQDDQAPYCKEISYLSDIWELWVQYGDPKHWRYLQRIKRETAKQHGMSVPSCAMTPVVHTELYSDNSGYQTTTARLQGETILIELILMNPEPGQGSFFIFLKSNEKSASQTKKSGERKHIEVSSLIFSSLYLQ